MTESKYWKNKWIGREKESVNNFARRSFEKIKNKGFKTLLDLGCGDGRDSIYFSGKGFSVTAVDFSESGIAKLKSLNIKNIHCLQKDIKKINFPQSSFDVIYAHLSLHYFDDKTTTRIFQKLLKILRKGGYIFVKCKSTEDPLFGKGKKIGENIYRKEHTRRFFTKNYMSEKLYGFKIIKIRKTSSVYHQYKSSFIEAIATK